MSQFIQTGSVNKEGASVTVNFPTPYAVPPTVLISPFYKDSSGGVGFIPTITEITQQNFTVTSSNAASNYFVNWLAIGQKLG